MREMRYSTCAALPIWHNGMQHERRVNMAESFACAGRGKSFAIVNIGYRLFSGSRENVGAWACNAARFAITDSSADVAKRAWKKRLREAWRRSNPARSASGGRYLLRTGRARHAGPLVQRVRQVSYGGQVSHHAASFGSGRYCLQGFPVAAAKRFAVFGPMRRMPFISSLAEPLLMPRRVASSVGPIFSLRA